MKLIEYPDAVQMMGDLALTLGRSLEQALAQHPTVTFAVPGGTTPGPVFDALSAIDLDWSRVHILLTDERWVPESNDQSNAALIRKRLLRRQAAAAHFTPYFTSGYSPQRAAVELDRQLSDILPVNVLLLGMGADMHTASLFPKADGLDAALAADAPMFLTVTVEGQDIQRFTLTAPVLRGALDTHVLITGAEKRAALGVAQTLTEAEAPIQTVLPRATIHWSAS